VERVSVECVSMHCTDPSRTVILEPEWARTLVQDDAGAGFGLADEDFASAELTQRLVEAAVPRFVGGSFTVIFIPCSYRR
jgi:hypothetical protein